jgi:BirA family transcriptional regulator, biotin operon repressor / biotin---[acetyl-CoA-carboxylase] ligase
MPDSLAPDAVEQLLRGRFGRPYVYEGRTTSTQDLLDSSMEEGAVAVTEEQTAGRGRMGRKWEAPPQTSIHCSVLLKPPPERRAPELSLVAGVAVADAIERTIGLAVQIKWPNDVMLRRWKVAGCLAEKRGDAVVLGIGINVNQRRDQLPPVTRSPPGSLYLATGQDWPRAPLLAMMLDDLERCYSDWLVGGLEATYPNLGARDFLRGRRVSVNGTSGTAEMIDRDGRLRIAVGHGESVTVESGEVAYER